MYFLFFGHIEFQHANYCRVINVVCARMDKFIRHNIELVILCTEWIVTFENLN